MYQLDFLITDIKCQHIVSVFSKKSRSWKKSRHVKEKVVNDISVSFSTHHRAAAVFESSLETFMSTIDTGYLISKCSILNGSKG